MIANNIQPVENELRMHRRRRWFVIHVGRIPLAVNGRWGDGVWTGGWRLVLRQYGYNQDAKCCITSTPFVANTHVLEKSMNTQAELRMRESVDQRI